MSGCINKPDTGPATNTIAIFDFDKPSERRYGEAGRSSFRPKMVDILACKLTIRHLNAPKDLNTQKPNRQRW
jgi:hypothetical protein